MDPALWSHLIPLLSSHWELSLDKHVNECPKDLYLPLLSLHLTWAPRVQRLEEEEGREAGCCPYSQFEKTVEREGMPFLAVLSP